MDSQNLRLKLKILKHITSSIQEDFIQEEQIQQERDTECHCASLTYIVNVLMGRFVNDFQVNFQSIVINFICADVETGCISSPRFRTGALL